MTTSDFMVYDSAVKLAAHKTHLKYLYLLHYEIFNSSSRGFIISKERLG